MDPITIGLSLASQFVPEILKYFKGDTAGAVAAQVIGLAQTVTGKGTPTEAEAALQADPALVMQFKMAVLASETDLEKAYLADVQNARARDAAFVEAGRHNYRANIMAAMAILLVAASLAVVVWSSAMDDFAKGTITLICGRALGWVEQIFSFEFGTTRSSRTKDATISKLSGP